MKVYRSRPKSEKSIGTDYDKPLFMVRWQVLPGNCTGYKWCPRTLAQAQWTLNHRSMLKRPEINSTWAVFLKANYMRCVGGVFSELFFYKWLNALPCVVTNIWVPGFYCTQMWPLGWSLLGELGVVTGGNGSGGRAQEFGEGPSKRPSLMPYPI